MTVELRTGVDLIEIDRIERALEQWSERFLERVFTDAEIGDCAGKPESFAGRFAAKEAVSKALGLGMVTLRWRDIEVVRGPYGQPGIQLHGSACAAAQELGLSRFQLSISHSRTDAIAVVVAWGES